MMPVIRHKILKFFAKSIPNGELYPKWFLFLKSLLFPIDYIKWIAFKKNYDPYRNQWIFYGVRYSDELFKYMSETKKAFIFKKDGDTFLAKEYKEEDK
jgi:hypothetical protein